MKGIARINNLLLFGMAFVIPFINTWQVGGHTIGSFQQISILLAGYYLAVGRVMNRLNPAHRLNSRMTFYLVIFSLMVLFSMLWTANISGGFEQVGSIFEFLLIYVILSEVICYERAMDYIAAGLLLGLLLSVFIAVMQYLGHTEFNLYTDDQLNANTNIDNVDTGDSPGILRIWGPFGNALTFSLYLSVVGSFLYAHFKAKRKKLISVLILAITLIAITITVSRMAFFAFVIAIIATEIGMGSKSKRFRLITGVVLVLLLCGMVTLNLLENDNPLVERVLNSDADFKSGRLDIWSAGLQIFVDHPLWGSGPGSLNQELYRHGWFFSDAKNVNYSMGHVENYYLTVLFTFGFIPFLFYALFFIEYMKAAYRLFRQAGELGWRFLFTIFPPLLCFGLNNLINPILISDHRIQMLFAFLIATTNSFYKITRYDKSRDVNFALPG